MVEGVAQRFGLQRGGGHSLAVDGVEGSDGVAEQHPAEREPLQPLDVTPSAGRETVGDRLRQSLGGFEDVRDDGGRERSGVGDPRCVVGRGNLAVKRRSS
jgi:hypothetical protein